MLYGSCGEGVSNMSHKAQIFGNVYAGKRVLVTGHTGFKGAWISAWLLSLGAEVIGLSKDIPTQPSMFEVLSLQSKIKHIIGDVRDLDKMRRLIQEVKPDFVFHLAAQAIVSVSYVDPVDTISTNIMGTINILESLRGVDHPCTAVMITSDKCYENVEWIWGYRETDSLGGKDIYSGSKGAADIVIKSYIQSFFKDNNNPVRLGVGRAGNVIGGGDWAKDRIVADCMVDWSEGRQVEIRSPMATRPWQHVLEPLSGYLTLGMNLSLDGHLHGEAFNFGPRAEQNRTVIDLIGDLSEIWGIKPVDSYRVTDNIPFHEAGLLKLNCDKALAFLKWESNLNYAEMIKMVGSWYYDYYQKRSDMYMLTMGQIEEYSELARMRARTWITTS